MNMISEVNTVLERLTENKWNELAQFVLDVSYALPMLLDKNQAAHILDASRSPFKPTRHVRHLIATKMQELREAKVSYKKWVKATNPLYNFLDKIAGII